MRVRLYRPIQQRRARCLLGIALLLPAAGFFQAAGVNPVTVMAAVALGIASAIIVVMALRPVAVVLRTGLLITGSFGQSSASIAWSEIAGIESTEELVAITTRGNMLYQVQVSTRAARLLDRMMGHTLSAHTSL